MEKKTDLSELLVSIEEGNIQLTKEQKEQLKQVLKKPTYNNKWDKLKAEFKTEFEKYNYIKNDKQVICSISLQETIATLLRIKYKTKNVREIQEPYENIKNFTMQILDILGKDRI